jgi:hypothetical protein
MLLDQSIIPLDPINKLVSIAMKNLSVNLSQFERQYKIKEKLSSKIAVPTLKITLFFVSHIL